MSKLYLTLLMLSAMACGRPNVDPNQASGLSTIKMLLPSYKVKSEENRRVYVSITTQDLKCEKSNYTELKKFADTGADINRSVLNACDYLLVMSLGESPTEGAGQLFSDSQIYYTNKINGSPGRHITKKELADAPNGTLDIEVTLYKTEFALPGSPESVATGETNVNIEVQFEENL